MSNINSHIRMPKCVLKQFEDEKHFVYFWSFGEGQIKKGHAESINTELGYYSESIEHFLRDSVETPMGSVLKFIKGIDIDSPEFTMRDDMKRIMRRFVHALVARSTSFLEKINEESVYTQFLPKRDQHDTAVIMGIEGASKSHVFEDWEITFMENHTEIPFVLPLSGSYSFSYNGDTMFNVPITPNYAITFMHESVAHKFVTDDKMRLFQVINSQQAMRFNMFALSYEQKDCNYGIAANSRRVLEKMKELAQQEKV